MNSVIKNFECFIGRDQNSYENNDCVKISIYLLCNHRGGISYMGIMVAWESNYGFAKVDQKEDIAL